MILARRQQLAALLSPSGVYQIVFGHAPHIRVDFARTGSIARGVVGLRDGSPRIGLASPIAGLCVVRTRSWRRVNTEPDDHAQDTSRKVQHLAKDDSEQAAARWKNAGHYCAHARHKLGACTA
jgi:hypothetical protein